ncbi:MAG: iron-containing alcohol dehydrogenase, partial [Ruminiclostridium sp.]|nr:iron-containing alcohol dehydrogenase [Ruminiclostridium sp.]
HACSFPLTSIYGIPHGEACGLTLDFFTRINAGDERTQQLARSLGFVDANELAECIYELKKRVGLRTDLKDLHLGKEKVKELAEASHHPNLDNNPVKITDKILYELYSSLI